MPNRHLLAARVAVAFVLAALIGCAQENGQDQTGSLDSASFIAESAAIQGRLTPARSEARSSATSTANPVERDNDVWAALEDEKKRLIGEIKQARDEYAQAKDETRTAARERMLAKQKELSRLSRYRKLPAPKNIKASWQEPYWVERDTEEAQLVVRVGDVDNLGFGWPSGFDPFSGDSTPQHTWPWQPEADDPSGTDRVMVISGFRDRERAKADGYSTSTDRPYNEPQPLTIRFPLDGIEIKGVALQLFVDDFQAPVFGNRYEVKLDGRAAPDLSASINALSQTGPIGKLLTLQLLPEYNELLLDGELVISIDDPHTNVGDGFAIDFARLLINPKQWSYVGVVRGVAQDKETGKPIAGVLVSAGNVQQVETGADGRFELEGVPAGMVVTTGTHPEYQGASDASDLKSGETLEIVLEMEKNKNTSEAIADQLEAEGKVDLYGIYFDVDKDTLKAESEPTLQQVRQLLIERAVLKLVVTGHTDSDGSAEYNLDLSRRRAAAVVEWLTARGIEAERLEPQGMGETQPVADNATPAGRALNRRVEIRDARRR